MEVLVSIWVRTKGVLDVISGIISRHQLKQGRSYNKKFT